MLRQLLLIGLFAACSKASTSLDSGDTTADTNPIGEDSAQDSDTARDTSPPESNAPVILSCDAYCELHQTGENYWKWVVDCGVTDPDGVKNIWNGTSDVSQNGNVVANYLVACNTEGSEAVCTTGFREEVDGILCSQASSYSFSVAISDWDGNQSKPFTVIGRQL